MGSVPFGRSFADAPAVVDASAVGLRVPSTSSIVVAGSDARLRLCGPHGIGDFAS